MVDSKSITPMTIIELEELLVDLDADDDLTGMKAVAVIADDFRKAVAAIRELIAIRRELVKIAIDCTDRDAANRLSELVGVEG